jgi:hypothetical protein
MEKRRLYDIKIENYIHNVIGRFVVFACPGAGIALERICGNL